MKIQVEKSHLLICLSSKRSRTQGFALKGVAIFTEQMNESNPVLTTMSDAMSEQSDVVDAMEEEQEGWDCFGQRL